MRNSFQRKKTAYRVELQPWILPGGRRSTEGAQFRPVLLTEWNLTAPISETLLIDAMTGIDIAAEGKTKDGSQPRPTDPQIEYQFLFRRRSAARQFDEGTAQQGANNQLQFSDKPLIPPAPDRSAIKQ
jgi:hypothetical protein